MKQLRFRSALLAFSTLLSAGVFVACGGGSGGGSFGAPGNIPATPTACPQGYTGSAPNCQQVSSPGQFTPITVPSATALPALAGYSGTIYIPAANPASPVQMTLSLQNPTSVTFSSVRRAGRVRIASASNTALLYITLAPSPGPVTFTGNPGFPGFQITLPSSAGSGPFYLAQLQGSKWTTVAGPATSSGGAVTLQPQLPELSLPPTAYFVLYTGGVVPSVAPSQSPGGQPTSTASAGPTASASSNPTGSASPIPSPSSSATLPPTTSPSATTSPTTYPTTPATATPSPAPNASPVISFAMGTYPNVNWGDASSINNQPISGFEALTTGGEPITGSYANNVTVTSSSSVVTLSVLGGSSGQSVTLTSGTQVLAMTYNGAATNPVTITASASGATTGTAIFAPVAQPIVYTPPSNLPATCSDICLYAPQGGGPGSTYTFTATQAGYTGSFGKSLSLNVPSACNAFANVQQTGTTTFAVSSTATPSPGSCTIVIGGFGSTTLSVTITYTTFGVTLQ
ncbi:MAG TPA: hypothetical protein VF741_05680 [Candidatus Aquilonibacter sp.]